MEPGTKFKVVEERRDDSSGILYLKLADGRGWLFDVKPPTGRMCVRSAVEVEAPRGCCSFIRRRWKCLLIGFVFWLVALFVVIRYVPSWIIQGRLNGANISLESASFLLDKTTAQMVKPHVRVEAPQSLLALPMISYTATIHPFKAQILMDLQSLDSGANKLVELGEMSITDEIELNSWNDVDMALTGDFNITSGDYLPQVVHRFLFADKLGATMTATLDVSALVWGWIPLYFPGITAHYTAYIAGFDGFKHHTPMLKEILTAHGEPGKLTVGCTAYVDNPSPMSLTVNDDVSMRVGYVWQGEEYIVGKVATSDLNFSAGMNVVHGVFTVEQTPQNSQAIVGLITSYMGGTQTGFLPAGTKPFLVDILDNGDASANSPLMIEAMKGLNASLNFRPQPLNFLKSITADVVVGGSIIHGELYTATIHIVVSNPLPTTARVKSVSLEAFHKDLNGPKLYTFDRPNLDTNVYVVPPGKDVVLSFSLNPLREFFFPNLSPQEIWDLAHEAADSKVTVGINADVVMIIDPAYEQEINYKNNKVSGEMCYHAFTPSKICGGLSDSLEALPLVMIPSSPSITVI